MPLQSKPFCFASNSNPSKLVLRKEASLHNVECMTCPLKFIWVHLFTLGVKTNETQQALCNSVICICTLSHMQAYVHTVPCTHTLTYRGKLFWSTLFFLTVPVTLAQKQINTHARLLNTHTQIIQLMKVWNVSHTTLSLIYCGYFICLCTIVA